jgi:amino acid transporter
LQADLSKTQATQDNSPSLIRGVGLAGATALNMIDMIGVGPFITIPLIVSAMGGPQAMLGWVLGAGLAICDGLVWAELGASFPQSGGSYGYLKEIYGPRGLGRLISFLFIWQLTFSAPLSIASGCVGLSQYAGYLFPSLSQAAWQRSAHLHLLGTTLDAHLVATGGTLVAIAACLLAVLLLYRRITAVSRLSQLLWLGVMATIAWVIFAGVTHFHAALAFSFPPGAFTLDRNFFLGLGAALLVSAYDYWGYYNVCFFGGEVKEPGRTIPRALILSIVLVAAIYIVMNISILGVVPWQELQQTAASDTHRYVISVMMERLYGPRAAAVVTVLIMWVAFASVFSLLLGYSRVPYAAALDGNYFKMFARVHPEGRFPHVAVVVLGAVAAAFCFLRLQDIIAALVVIRIVVQFLLQTVGIVVLRARRPQAPRPFRMWLYPLPAVLATAGFLYVLVMRKGFLHEVRYAAALVVLGVAIYLVRAWRRKEWPLGGGVAAAEARE